MSELVTFLVSKGLLVSDDQKSVLESSSKTTQVIPLLHQRILSVKGLDTEKFLQGQLTCDVTAVMTRGSSLGAHCNIKGHMISLFRLIKVSNEEIWMRLSYDTFDSALANLKKYIVFSKAEAEEITNEVAGVGINGPGAQALIEKLFGQSPSEDNGTLKLNNGVVVRVPGERFEIWMQHSDLVGLLGTLPDEVGFGSTDSWILSEVDSGIPDLRADTQEDFIPQMTNLQALGGVSFTKGCYTGQEIVTRLQHRGVLKKPMYLLEAKAGTPPLPGQTISSSSSARVGTIVQAAPFSTEESLYHLLAVINKKAADEDELKLTETDSSLKILELPYQLDPELFSRKEPLV
ncbi:MAG: YgfZ/GcvT domain-containing protein [Neptuniibacter sp.]